MKKLYFQALILRILFLAITFILFLLIIVTPILVTRSVYVTKNIFIDEEIIEVILLTFLVILGSIIFKLYQIHTRKQEEQIQEIRKAKKSVEEKLYESMKYIGKVNVQIDEIRSLFSTTNRYPETKSDFKKSIRFLSEHVFGIVNTDWVLFRIIGSATLKTICECFETRNGFSNTYPKVSNKRIVENNNGLPYTTIISQPQDLNFLVCCTLPIETIHTEQKVFIQAIVKEVAMLFVILNSKHYMDSNHTAVKKESPKKNIMSK